MGPRCAQGRDQSSRCAGLDRSRPYHQAVTVCQSPPTHYHPHMQKRRAALLAIAALVATAACGGDPLSASALAGLYRLATVDGQALPYVSPPSGGGLSAVIPYGDLALRGDRTFGLGIGGPLGGFLSGRFRIAGDEIRFTIPSFGAGQPETEFTGAIGGDSVVVDFASPTESRRHVFRRTQRDPVTVAPGIYTLATINGRGEPLTLHEDVIGGNRHSTRIVFDSITFIDAVFYRRYRAEETVVEYANGEIIVSPSSNEMTGAYGGTAEQLTFRQYYGIGSDVLTVVGGALVRTSALFGGTLVERYERRP